MVSQRNRSQPITKMNSFIQNILKGHRPQLEEFLDHLNPPLRLMDQLTSTPQDPIWHAEGNVWIHTKKVLEQLYRILDTEANHLSDIQKTALILSATLHDIGKPLTTKEREIEGQVRIVAPGHEAQGSSYLAFRLLEFDIPYDIIQTILSLVYYHLKPKLLIVKDAPKREFFQLARCVDVELLYYLAKADMLGRECSNRSEQVDLIHLFKLLCEEYGLWQNPDPYATWKQYIFAEVAKESQDFVYGSAIVDYEAGLINSPQEAVPKYYNYMNCFPQLVFMFGMSGSGKSQWIKEHLEDYKIISLDVLRKQMAKCENDQSKNSEIVQKALKDLKINLAKGEKIVWDATNLRKDFRRILFNLGKNYHALVTMAVFHQKLSIIEKGNKNRSHPVPEYVFQNQLDRLEWVELTEAHRVIFIEQNCEKQRIGFS